MFTFRFVTVLFLSLSLVFFVIPNKTEAFLPPTIQADSSVVGYASDRVYQFLSIPTFNDSTGSAKSSDGVNQAAAVSFFDPIGKIFESIVTGFSRHLGNGLDYLKEIITSDRSFSTQSSAVEEPIARSVSIETRNENNSESGASAEPKAVTEITKTFDLTNLKTELKAELENYIRTRIDSLRPPVVAYTSLSSTTTAADFQSLKTNEILSLINGAVRRQSNSDANRISTNITSITNDGTFTNPVITGGTITGSPISGASGSFTTLSASGNLTIDTSGLVYDSGTGNVGIGTTSPSDTLAINGAMYLASISVPSVTANRIYNAGGDLYWAGNAIGGSTTGTWTTDGTNVWRAGGSVGIGTTSPYARLSVEHLSSTGTVIGADALTGFTGNLLDLKVASTTKFVINQ
ncbi:MAG: hypothetical protein COX06_00005, partial [Candidatus Zambryskibacteria bacterium CG22_combo_CG10-13_8_21_14_all_42_17]